MVSSVVADVHVRPDNGFVSPAARADSAAADGQPKLWI